MKLQAKLSAPRPTQHDARRPVPSAQLMTIRLAKKAANAKPRPSRLKPKKRCEQRHRHHATSSLMRLTIISAATNSAGRRGLIIRWPRLRDHISSRNATENPSWPRTRMSHSSTAPMNSPAAWRRSRHSARVALQKAPHQHLHQRPVDQLGRARPGRADHVPVAQHHRAEAARRRSRSAGALGHGRAPRRASPAPRAMARNTSSRLARPKRLISGGRLVGDDAAFLQHDHPVGEPLHLRHVVRGQHDRRRALATVALEPGRTQSAVSGSSEAVGSSSSSSSGSLSSALARPRGSSARPKLAVRPIQQLGELELAGDLGDAPLEVAHAVEPGEDLEVLPHGEPHRHVDVGALEVHPVQHLVALARHVGAEHACLPRGRHDQPHQHGDGGGLAGAVAAEQRRDRAARERKLMPSTAATSVTLQRLTRRSTAMARCDAVASHGPRRCAVGGRGPGAARKTRNAGACALGNMGGAECAARIIPWSMTPAESHQKQRRNAAPRYAGAAALVRRDRPASPCWSSISARLSAAALRPAWR